MMMRYMPSLGSQRSAPRSGSTGWDAKSKQACKVEWAGRDVLQRGRWPARQGAGTAGVPTAFGLRLEQFGRAGLKQRRWARLSCIVCVTGKTTSFRALFRSHHVHMKATLI